LPGNRCLLLARSEEDAADGMDVPGWDLFQVAVCEVVERSISWNGQADAAVITSRHAARWFLTHCPGFDGPIAASGPATAKILREAGFACTVPTRHGGKDALDALEQPAGARILFPCGERTAGTVETRARERGLGLERLVVYGLKPCEGLVIPDSIDVFAFWSGQMVSFFKDAMGESRWERLRQLPVLCLEGTSQDALLTLGWSGEMVVLEKTPLQAELSSILLRLVTSCGLTGGRSRGCSGQGAEDSLESARFTGLN